MIKKTSLYNRHLNLKAKIIPFSGFEMPVNYDKGILHEYNSVRNLCGIFDVSHMGQFYIYGDKSYEFFNVETNTNSSGNNTSMASLYLNGSTINSLGMIEIPVIGKIFLLGQNLEEAKISIQKIVDEYEKDAHVIVKLANFQVTILGEVNKPGTFPVFKENVTIFEALALAGDLSDYANRQKIKIVRTYNNKKKIYTIDLTNQQLLLSDFYYLRNNDMIYVEPLKYRTFRKSQSQIVLSALTTLALMVNVFLRIAE